MKLTSSLLLCLVVCRGPDICYPARARHRCHLLLKPRHIESILRPHRRPDRGAHRPAQARSRVALPRSRYKLPRLPAHETSSHELLRGVGLREVALDAVFDFLQVFDGELAGALVEPYRLPFEEEILPAQVVCLTYLHA